MGNKQQRGRYISAQEQFQDRLSEEMWLEDKDGGVKAGVWRADQPVPVREAVPTERAYIIRCLLSQATTSKQNIPNKQNKQRR